MPPRLNRTIEVVLKVTERCNIDCSYCYVFNKGDDSYKRHDPYVKADTIAALIVFLKKGVEELGAQVLRIDFHGGEPLLLGKTRFAKLCDLLHQTLSPAAIVHFNLQTNGLLIDESWIDIFERFRIAVGISLDGPRELNDLERVDFRGRGTYDRAVKGLNIVKTARSEGRIPSFGVLVVATPNYSGSETYKHFVHTLGVDYLDFLLPIDSHESFDHETAGAYGDFLIAAFDEWVKDDDPSVLVRIFSESITFLRDGQEAATMSRRAREGAHSIITVASNGDIGPDDSLRTLNLGLFSQHNVKKTTLSEYLASPGFQALTQAESRLPTLCGDCCWKYLCRGGAAHGRLINRFSVAKGFNNTSVVCLGLRRFYAHLAGFVLRAGFPFDRLKQSLIQNSAELGGYTDACEFSIDQFVA